jgi:hypothetical protein
VHALNGYPLLSVLFPKSEIEIQRSYSPSCFATRQHHGENDQSVCQCEPIVDRYHASLEVTYLSPIKICLRSILSEELVRLTL